jgi:hypothetical protein
MIYEKLGRIGRLAALSAIGVVLSVSASHAGLLGSTVNVSAFFPDTSSLFSNGGDTTVSGAIEYPSGSFPTYNTTWQVDITDTQMIISDAGAQGGFPFGPATFNGFILTVLSGPVITSAVTDAASQFSPVDVTVVGGNEVEVNFEGVDASNATPLTSIIDIETTSSVAVAEPTSLALIGVGLLGLGVLRRRQMR